jgi:hypothetical protein
MTHGSTESPLNPITVFTAKIEGPNDILVGCQALFAALDPRPSRGFFGAITQLNDYLLTHQGPWLMGATESNARVIQGDPQKADVGPPRFPRIHEPFLSEMTFNAFMLAYDAAYPQTDLSHRQAFVDIIPDWTTRCRRSAP